MEGREEEEGGVVLYLTYDLDKEIGIPNTFARTLRLEL